MKDAEPAPSSGLDPWYVTGFLDGEGCFTFSRSGRALALYFAIKAADRDRGILEEIRTFFGGAGRIYEIGDRPARIPGGRPSKAACYFRVARLTQLKAVIDHLDRYPLRGPRAATYALWREIFQRKWDSGRRAADPEIEELARRLSRVSSRNPVPKDSDPRSG